MPRRDEQRRSSMSTLFELRGRSWLVRSLLVIVLAAIGAGVTWMLR